ncbi:MAG: hypothetical protein Q7S04_02350 [Candidatus Moranbacteria bacterium]|nr:hypothetical protein [Candidatus Moranbacteria bacterium]
MLEKKRQDKIKTLIPLEKTVAEILVANGRSIEPFIKVFTYSGENVTKSQLGTLIGVFEIAERSEDSAYIVNFLASVAKKEYFNNPRRNAIESFEAALHRVNLALAELVKDGNIAWLGKYHGALGIVEKNNLHFSVTGSAEILLLRNDNLTEISLGLASEESHTHPIKTFVEVSSGHLMPQDKIIFTSPELLELLPVEDLKKNALRMDGDHFEQFLRTVLINELDMAGTIVIDFQEGKPLPPPQKQEEESSETTQNVFSQETFTSKTKVSKTDSPQKENQGGLSAPEEYVDSKTGHIYVQGDTLGKTETSQSLERIKLSLQNMLHGLSSFLASQRKLLRKGKKSGSLFFAELVRAGGTATRKTVRFLRKQWQKKSFRKFSPFPRETPIQQTKEETPIFHERPEAPKLLTQSESVPAERKTEAPLPAETLPDTDIPLFMKEKLNAFYRKNGVPRPFVPPEKFPPQNFIHATDTIFSFIRKISRQSFDFLSLLWKRGILVTQALFRRVSFLLKNLSPQRRQILLIGGITGIVLLVTGIWFLTRPSSNNSIPVAEAPKQQPATPVFPPNTEKNAHLLASPTVFTTQKNPLVASVVLDNVTYLITEKSIISLNDKKQYTLPGSGSARLAATMDHLSLIFIYASSDELFAWSPISRTFVKNTLTLPTGAVVKDIGAYLTYLYVLDATTNQIYRFPRAEGGFGQGSPWIKDNIVFKNSPKMAVSDTIFLTPDNTSVQAFSRGHLAKNLETPHNALSVTALFTHPGLANVYALDATNKRVLVWNQDGTLLTQYFSEQLATTKTITVNETSGEILVTTSNALLSFKIDKKE